MKKGLLENPVGCFPEKGKPVSAADALLNELDENAAPADSEICLHRAIIGEGKL
jgi:hypothetical protein